MKLIIIVIVIVVILVILMKSKGGSSSSSEGNSDTTVAKAAPLTKEEKNARWEFQKSLDRAGEYGPYAIEKMLEVRDAYETGKGTEQNMKMAYKWNMKAALDTLQLKVYCNGFSGFSIVYWLDTLKHLDGGMFAFVKYFGDHGNLKDAEKLSMIMLKMGHEGAIKCLDYVQKLSDQASGNDSEEKQPSSLTFAQQYGMYLAYLAGIHARSEKIYEDLKAEMHVDNVTEGTPQAIDWLLKKAGWQIEPSEAVFPGESEELNVKFEQAREVEQLGNDFKKAEKLYESIAQAGHTEAQRRLGRIQCDIRSKYFNDEKDLKGQAWLAKAADGGNAIAAFELERPDINVAQIAALAKAGNRDALYVLGCLLENGQGGTANWGVSQAIFHILWDQIGDAVNNKDGEGIEWKRKLGEKMGMGTEEFHAQLAREGSDIGYAPSQYIFMCMTRDFALYTDEKFKGVKEENGRMSGYFDRNIWEFGAAPSKAGLAKAAVLVKYHEEQNMYTTNYCRDKLQEAELGKGPFTGSSMSPKERVAMVAADLQAYITAAYMVRKSYGIPSLDELYHKNKENKECDPDEWMKKLQEDQATRGSGSGSESIDDMPGLITDDLGRTWQRDGLYGDYAVYKLSNYESVMPGDFGDSLGDTVYIRNKDISGNSARTILRTFNW
jgi:TPR repeat protein